MASDEMTVTVTVDPELVDEIQRLQREVARLKPFEQAMQRMAAQYVHPKTTAEEMVESILQAKKL